MDSAVQNMPTMLRLASPRRGSLMIRSLSEGCSGAQLSDARPVGSSKPVLFASHPPLFRASAASFDRRVMYHRRA